MESTKTLILITIGPVQEFIAQARRTRDLWFGSYILSELAKAGAKQFEESNGKLIYPVIVNNNWDQVSAPNKILGIVETDNPRDFVRNVRRAITAKWMKTARAAQDKVDSFINIGTWERQINELIEFNAAWTTLEHWENQSPKDGETPYSRALQHVEELLAARKTLRDFRPNNPGRAFGEVKSSLDGGRESVWSKGRPEDPDLTKLGIKKFETLDAISVVKRMSFEIYPQKEKFYSVCETAFHPYQDYINKEKGVQQEVDHYLQAVAKCLGMTSNDQLMRTDGEYDARLFYARRIEDFLEEQRGLKAPEVEEKKKVITSQLERLYQSGNKPFHVKQPSPYYAFLVADGDRMGDHLRRIKDKDSHRRFSEGLSRFAIEASDIMKKHQGILVYGGGDDVMGYLPLHKCLDAVQELRQSFARKMQEYTSSAPDTSFTLSAGIAIVHMLEPLEEVRQLAHAAEKEAKITRDTLAIHFHKRGGDDLMRVVLPFSNNPAGQMKKIQRWMTRNHLFSVKFAYELRELYRTYESFTAPGQWLYESDSSTLSGLLWQEIERLAVKKKPEKVSKEQIEAWMTELKTVFPLSSSEQPLHQLKHMAEQFILAIHLEKEGVIYEEKPASLSS